jgi:hypothetical protein
MTGCKATPGYQGGHRAILATYRFRTLTADLPATVRVPAVVAAARQALADRGYAVRPARTEDEGTLEATAPEASDFERVVVSARLTSGGTRVQVTVEPLGDQAESRAILDGILGRLGL